VRIPRYLKPGWIRPILQNIALTLRYFMGLLPAPTRLYLEVVNVCNADCVFCAYRHDKRPKRRLALDVIQRTAAEFQRLGGDSISFSPTLGETFADKDALKKIEAVRDIGFAHMYTYTNASLLHRFGVENVLRSGLTVIRISLAPLDAEIYRSIYQNQTYPDVLKNVRDLLIAFAATTDRTVQEIYLEFRSDRPLEACQEMPDYKTHIAPYLVPHVHLTVMTYFDGWSGAIAEQDLMPGMTLLDPDSVGSKRLPCGRMFSLQVLSDGSIRQCGCRVDTQAAKDGLVIGHIDDMTLAEAFQSDQARENIASFIKGKPLDVCRKCSWYHPVP
jgi:hypothetical protein